MVVRAPRRAASVVVLSLGACLPSSPPATLLAEDFEVIGLRMEVVEPGPLSTDLLPIPADRVRSEALPGDRIRLTALVANEDGELDLEPLEPRWLLSSRAYLDVGVGSIEPCDPSQPLPGGASCDAGTGAFIELTVQDLAPERPFYLQDTNVLFVVGVVVPTEECLERLMTDVSQLSLDCMVGRRSLNLGPAPRVVELMLEQGIPLGDESLPSELPPLTIELAPNFAPRTPWITLSRPGEVRRAWPGERVELPAGAAYALSPAIEGRDQQDYLDFGPGGFSIRSESLTWLWHTTAPVLVNRGARLQVPDEAGTSFTVFVVTTDSRESQTWSIFDFDVVAP